MAPGWSNWWHRGCLHHNMHHSRQRWHKKTPSDFSVFIQYITALCARKTAGTLIVMFGSYSGLALEGLSPNRSLSTYHIPTVNIMTGIVCGRHSWCNITARFNLMGFVPDIQETKYHVCYCKLEDWLIYEMMGSCSSSCDSYNENIPIIMTS